MQLHLQHDVQFLFKDPGAQRCTIKSRLSFVEFGRYLTPFLRMWNDMRQSNEDVQSGKTVREMVGIGGVKSFAIIIDGVECMKN